MAKKNEPAHHTPRFDRTIDPNQLHDIRDLALRWGWSTGNLRSLRDAIHRTIPEARIYMLGNNTYLVDFRFLAGGDP